MKVKEIFYSIQGEGARFGIASIFIRLSDCNLKCWYCDTDWSNGSLMAVKEILDKVKTFPCKNIIWTGGEPTLQLTAEIVQLFKNEGYFQSIETNGTNVPPYGLDYIACSPKVNGETLKSNFKDCKVNEFRYPISKGDQIPAIEDLPIADDYMLSPVFLGEDSKRFERNEENIEYCLSYIKRNPGWRMSIQMHKLLNVQ